MRLDGLVFKLPGDTPDERVRAFVRWRERAEALGGEASFLGDGAVLVRLPAGTPVEGGIPYATWRAANGRRDPRVAGWKGGR